MTEPSQHPGSSEHIGRHLIHIKIDGTPHTLADPDSTPNAILRLASIDPATHYLVRLTGRKRESFKDKGEQSIKVKDGDVFVSVSVGPTPVS